MSIKPVSSNFPLCNAWSQNMISLACLPFACRIWSFINYDLTQMFLHTRCLWWLIKAVKNYTGSSFIFSIDLIQLSLRIFPLWAQIWALFWASWLLWPAPGAGHVVYLFLLLYRKFCFRSILFEKWRNRFFSWRIIGLKLLLIRSIHLVRINIEYLDLLLRLLRIDFDLSRQL